jgi:hypothetical protein
MCRTFFAIFFVAIALLLALLASVLPQGQLTSIVYFSRFFDIMLPVLAVGALIKYLFTLNKSCAVCDKSCQKSCK